MPNLDALAAAASAPTNAYGDRPPRPQGFNSALEAPRTPGWNTLFEKSRPTGDGGAGLGPDGVLVSGRHDRGFPVPDQPVAAGVVDEVPLDDAVGQGRVLGDLAVVEPGRRAAALIPQTQRVWPRPKSVMTLLAMIEPPSTLAATTGPGLASSAAWIDG